MGMEEFTDQLLPEYAILSHTWGAEEVTYRDFQDTRKAGVMAGLFRSEARQKAGWAKIDHAIQLTKEAKLDYLWVDTCCIDKSSSAELQEAINSMYRWYERSTICFAILSDVICLKMTDTSFVYDWERIERIKEQPALRQKYSSAEIDANSTLLWNDNQAFLRDQIEGRNTPSSILSTSLTVSRWFTRGWTLQELVAPTVLQFYDQEYQFIGLKHELSGTIQLRTGIDGEILKNKTRLDSMSVAQRMSWAAGRETSRVEDRAYSLLGIFGVNMPMIYGEGEKAFYRLQEEIIKASDDHSIFAWETVPSDAPNSGALLATSPDEFAHGGGIVTGGNPTIFEMTNRGLRTELLIRKAFSHDQDGSPEFAALLNCHFRDQMNGTIALRLFKPVTSEQFFPVSGMAWSPLAFDGPTKLKENSRLAFISNSTMASCNLRSLQIARCYRPFSGVVFKVLLQHGFDYPCMARPVEFYPKTGWEMDPPVFRTTAWSRVRAGVIYECQSGVRFAVVFGYDVRVARMWAHHYESDHFAGFCEGHHAHLILYDNAYITRASSQARRIREAETMDS